MDNLSNFKYGIRQDKRFIDRYLEYIINVLLLYSKECQVCVLVIDISKKDS